MLKQLKKCKPASHCCDQWHNHINPAIRPAGKQCCNYIVWAVYLVWLSIMWSDAWHNIVLSGGNTIIVRRNTPHITDGENLSEVELETRLGVNVALGNNKAGNWFSWWCSGYQTVCTLEESSTLLYRSQQARNTSSCIHKGNNAVKLWNCSQNNTVKGLTSLSEEQAHTQASNVILTSWCKTMSNISILGSNVTVLFVGHGGKRINLFASGFNLCSFSLYNRLMEIQLSNCLSVESNWKTSCVTAVENILGSGQWVVLILNPMNIALAWFQNLYCWKI